MAQPPAGRGQHATSHSRAHTAGAAVARGGVSRHPTLPPGSHFLPSPPHTSPQAELDDKMPGQLWLEEECRTLSELIQRGGASSTGSVEPVEMPGQYLSGTEIGADGVVLLEAISCNVAIVRRHSSSYRRLVLWGSNGHPRHMLVQTGQNWAQVRRSECGGRGGYGNGFNPEALLPTLATRM
eukprot:22882-Chlamydomonas_euryale.AAC.3